MYTLEVRSLKQLDVLKQFSRDFYFDDHIQLEVYMDFKRLTNQEVDELVSAIV